MILTLAVALTMVLAPFTVELAAPMGPIPLETERSCCRLNVSACELLAVELTIDETPRASVIPGPPLEWRRTLEWCRNRHAQWTLVRRFGYWFDGRRITPGERHETLWEPASH